MSVGTPTRPQPQRMTDKWRRAIGEGGLIGTTGSMSTTAAVGYTLANYADADGTSIYPSFARIQRNLGLSASSVSRAVRVLVEAGFLVRVRTPTAGRPTHFRLAIPAGLSVEPVESDGNQADDHYKHASHPDRSADEAARVAAFDAVADLCADEGHDDGPRTAAAPEVTSSAPAGAKPEQEEACDLSDVTTGFRVVRLVPSEPESHAFRPDDEGPRPEAERLGHFGAKAKVRREREAAKAARKPDEYRPRYRGG